MNNLTFLFITLLVVGTHQLKAGELQLGDFEAQVQQILEYQTLTESDYAVIQRAIDDLQQTMKRQWPGCELLLFGSIASGLGTPQSDVDSFLILPENILQNRSMSTILNEAVRALEQYGLYTDTAINMATETLKATHMLTNKEVHLHFTEVSYVTTTHLMKYYMSLNSEVWKLTTVIKYWSQVLKLYEVFRSYLFNMMVIFYSQQRLLVPSVAELQRNVMPDFSGPWNVAFQEIAFGSNNPRVDFFDLLLGFFAYYSRFTYEDLVISPYIGYPIPKMKFEHPSSLPGDFKLYKWLVPNKLTSPIDVEGKIYIQDPFKHNRNIVKDIDPLLVEKLRAALKEGYATYLENGDRDEYLKSLFNK